MTKARSLDDENESGTNRHRRGWWALATALGFVAAGVVVGVLGLLGDIRPGRGDYPGSAQLGATLVGAIVVALLATLARDTMRAREGRLVDEPREDSTGKRRSLSVRRGWAVLLAVVAAVYAVHVGLLVRGDLDDGFITRALPRLCFGFAFLALGGVLLALPPHMVSTVPTEPTETPGALRRRAATSALGLLVALVAAGVAVSVADTASGWPVHTETAPDADATGVGGPPTTVAWQRSLDDSSLWASDGANGAVGTVAGLAVSDGDRVVGLAAATGEEIWHYGRDRAEVTALAASPSGERVVAELAADNGPGSQLVTLDGRTGEVVAEWDTGIDIGMEIAPAMNDEVMILGWDRRPDDPGGFAGLRAYGVDDGNLRWEWTTPPGCYGGNTDFLYPARAVTADAVVVAIACSDPGSTIDPASLQRAVFVALDSGSGRELWRSRAHSRDAKLDAPTIELPLVVESSMGGSRLLLRWTFQDAGDDWSGDRVLGQRVVDAETGDPLTGVEEGPAPELPRSEYIDAMHLTAGGVVMWNDQAGAPVRVPVPGGVPERAASPCEHPWSENIASVADMALFACREEDEANLVVSPWDGSEITRSIPIDPGAWSITDVDVYVGPSMVYLITSEHIVAFE